LFNIAQAHRLAGPSHCDKALAAYETYLREDPQTSNHVEVEQRIGEMRACADQERASAAPAAPRAPAGSDTTKPDVATPPPDRAGPLPSPNAAPLVVTAAGGVLAATGAILYWRARVKFDHVKDTCPCPEGQFSSWQTATYASYGLLAVGGATLVGGLSWWFLDRRATTQRAYGVAVEPSGISFVGVF
jgi:hypothetical protein